MGKKNSKKKHKQAAISRPFVSLAEIANSNGLIALLILLIELNK